MNKYEVHSETKIDGKFELGAMQNIPLDEQIFRKLGRTCMRTMRLDRVFKYEELRLLQDLVKSGI